MKNRLLTISLREIKKSYKRFLSLLIMSFLGVGVFIGLRNTPGTMLNSLDKYYDESRHYDIKVVSTLGLTKKDVKSLNNLGMSTYGIHSKDVITNFKEDTQVVRIIGINNNINKILLNEGVLPQKDNEIVVERNVLVDQGLKIGDYIDIEKDESLKNSRFKIVGVTTSPLYLFKGGNGMTRGNTDIGNGKIQYYSYVKDSAFDVDYYTEIGILKTNKLMTSSNDYVDMMNKEIGQIESIKKEREKARYNEIIEKYNIEINEKEEEGKKQLSNAEDQLNNAKEEIDNGYRQLLSSKRQLDSSKVQLDETYLTLEQSRIELEGKEQQLNDAKKQLEDAEKELTEVLAPYGLTIDDVATIKAILNYQVVSKEQVKHLFQNAEHKEEIYNLIDELYDTEFFVNLENYIETKTEEEKSALIESIPKDIENYDEIVQEIESFSKDTLREDIYASIIDSANNIDDIKQLIPEDSPYYERIIRLLDGYADTVKGIVELFDAVDKINNGKNEIAKNELLLLDGKEQLNNGYRTYYSYLDQYNDGVNKYNIGYNDYKNGLSIYDSNLEKYLKNKLDFENEIEKAREKLKEIDRPKWYIFDRSDDSEYSGYINNTDSVKNLSSAFPTVFFLVAIFMCIMSMSRMALEDRGEIGTLKSLGFSNKHIILKYVIYSVSATLIGSIFGGIFGFYFLTWFISKMYGILYYIPYFEYFYNISPFIIGTIIAIVCITGTAILTVKKIVIEKPSNLLRPLAPNKGKKMLIENIPLWKIVSFSNKITVRNIVRYKKRVIMTVLGIAGCTVLLLTGYGIKDSITPVAKKQFENVFIYQDAVYMDHESDDISFITNDKSIKNYEEAYMQTVNKDGVPIDLLAVNGDDLNYDVINITDYKSHKKINIENNKVIISDKLASIYNYKVGDKISFSDADNEEYKFEISGIATNYFSYYIYMNIETYEKNFEEYIPNIVFINLRNGSDEEAVAKKFMKNEHVLSVVTKGESLKNVEAMLDSLSNVVLILIVLSGILSFVVLYNLSYINISERKREIATLKVLGFTHKEVDNYIIKENIIITILGIIIGLILAKPFVDYIVNTVEIDLVRFIHVINVSSYLYTFMFMILFALIVTIIIHFTLKKIDMIESLKTVE